MPFPYPVDSKFEIFRQDAGLTKNEWIGRFVDERAFYAVMDKGADFQYLEPVIQKTRKSVFGENLAPEAAFIDLFRKAQRVIKSPNKYYRWKLELEEQDNYVLFYEVINPSGAAKLGAYRRPFEIVVSADVFGYRDVVGFIDEPEVQVFFESDGIKYGDGFKYEVTLFGLPEDYYFPTHLIRTNSKIVRMNAPRGEAAIDRANIHFSFSESYVEYEVPRSRMGWDMEVTDDAWKAAKHAKIIAYDSTMSDAQIDASINAGRDMSMQNMPKMVVSNLDTYFMKETDKVIQRALIYGRAEGRVSGPRQDKLTLRDFETGPGFFEFLEGAARTDYNPETVSHEMLESYVNMKWVGKMLPGSHTMTISGGTGAYRVFQRMAESAEKAGFVKEVILNETPEQALMDPRRKAVAVNARQIVGFYVEPFGKIIFQHLPILDATTVSEKRYKDLPLRSYVMLANCEDDALVGEDANTYLVEDDTEDQIFYVVGGWTPTGAFGRNSPTINASYNTGYGSRNAYKIVRDWAGGYVIKDIEYLHIFMPVFLKSLL